MPFYTCSNEDTNQIKTSHLADTALKHFQPGTVLPSLLVFQCKLFFFPILTYSFKYFSGFLSFPSTSHPLRSSVTQMLTFPQPPPSVSVSLGASVALPFAPAFESVFTCSGAESLFNCTDLLFRSSVVSFIPVLRCPCP